jgi:glutathione S-transferase
MRARLALDSSATAVELREILLRDKAPAFLAASPSATVPCLVLPDGTVIDESLDIMLWALRNRDPEDCLQPDTGSYEEMLALIEELDGSFKTSLDRYKYASRHPDSDPLAERGMASSFLEKLDARLSAGVWLFGKTPSLADMACLPFVRQFANTDRTWFDAVGWSRLRNWLTDFEASDRFNRIMVKYPVWKEGDPPTVFAA